MAEFGIYAVASLIGAGLLIKTQEKYENMPTESKNMDRSLGENIYSSNEHDKNKAKEERKVESNWNATQDSENTGVVNEIGNRALDLIGGSLIPENNNFSHNNMVPFYSGSIKQNVSQDNRSFEGKLNLYSGNSRLHDKNKKEVPNMFQPQANIGNVHGWDGSGQIRDLDRYNPNNVGKKNNDLPFEQVRVGRGLADGYNSAPSGGFHNMVRIMPKSKSELRADAVLETEGRVKSGASNIKKRGLIGKVYKNRNKILVLNENGERNFATVGSVTKQKHRPNVVIKHTNRTCSKPIMGHAKSSITNKPKVRSRVMKSKKQNFYNSPFRNAGGENRVNDYGKAGFVPGNNNRTMTGSKSYTIGPKGPSKQIVNIQDSMKKTRKQFTIGNQRVYGNHGNVVKKSKAYNPREWRARTTVKETTVDKKHDGHVHGLVKKHKAWNTKEKARNTNRQFTSNNSYTGIAGSRNKKQKSYCNAYTARVNQNKEKVSQRRKPTNSGPNLGPSHNSVVETKKIDKDRENVRGGIKQTNVGSYHCAGVNLTSKKNTVSEKTQRLDSSILDAFKNNPLTQSLSSFY